MYNFFVYLCNGFLSKSNFLANEFIVFIEKVGVEIGVCGFVCRFIEANVNRYLYVVIPQ